MTRPRDESRRARRRGTTRGRRHGVLLGLAVILPLLGTGSSASPIAAEDDGSATRARIVAAPPVQIDLPTPGPLGSVSIIGDSVLQGAGRHAPTLLDQLAARGWGPIRFRAGAGYSTGYFGRSFELTATYWLERWRSEGWQADNVIVNLGANDTEFCATDVACSRQAILHVVDAVGPGRRVWWPKVTKFFTHAAQANAWNAALDLVATERDDFFTWDWPTELASGGYESNDNTHIRPASHPLRSLRMAEEFTVSVGRARLVGPPVDVDVALGEASTFVPLPAARVADTRTAGPTPTGGDTVRIDLAEQVPLGSTAAALYVAAAGATGSGYVTVTPCGAPGGTAALTFGTSTIGAPTIVALGDDLTVCVTLGGSATTAADLVVDLQGAFVDGTEGLRLRPLDPPVRAADTRSGDGNGAVDSGETIVVEAPDGARAVVLNLASAGAASGGFLTAQPCGTTSDTANLNYAPGPARSASAIVGVGDEGTVCVTASSPTDVVVDMTAFFTDPPDTADGNDDRDGDGDGDGDGADHGLAFLAIDPLRMLDTRDGTGGWAPIHGADQTLEVVVAPGWAEAVSGTISMVRPRRTGFVQATNCSGEPAVASVNAAAVTNVSNGVTTGLADAGTLCLRSAEQTHTVVDVTGWWVDATLVE